MELKLRQLSSYEEQEISRLLELSSESLYEECAEYIGVLEPGEEAESMVSRWINSRRKEIEEAVCVKGNYCTFIQEYSHATDIQIIASVADIIAGLCGGVPIYTVSTLLVTRFLHKLCNC